MMEDLKEKKVKVCIIENEIGSAYRIWEGLSEFYKEKKEERLVGRLIFVNIDNSCATKEAIDYFVPKIKEKGLEFEECEDIEKVFSLIGEDVQNEYVYLLDVCLKDKDLEKMKEKKEYICPSMLIYQMIKEKESYIYSRFVETEVVDEWVKVYKEQYQEDSPEIIEREMLVKKYFDESLGSKILRIAGR